MTRKLFLKLVHSKLVYWLTATVAILCFLASAQELGNTKIKDFSAVLDRQKPPFETQVKSLLQGSQAEPRGGLIFIRDAKLKTFRETGDLEMTVIAPRCVFDTAHSTVSSSGHLEVQSGDGRFSLEGEGFLWQKTNNVLIISNSMQTIIRGESKTASKK
jgi:hypothetical protein